MIIFDIDGTLIVSVDFHARAWQETLAHFGIPVAFEDVRSQIGKAIFRDPADIPDRFADFRAICAASSFERPASSF